MIEREQFFANKNKDLWDVSVAIKRGNPYPLDKDSVFESYDALQTYVETSPVAYPGQIIAVVEEAETKVYYLDQNANIVPIGKGDDEEIEIENLPQDLDVVEYVDAEGITRQKIFLIDVNDNPIGTGIELPKGVTGIGSTLSDDNSQIELYLKDANGDKIAESGVLIAAGTGGGGGGAYQVKFNRITPARLTITPNDKALITFTTEVVNTATGDTMGGYGVWKLGGRVLKNEELSASPTINEFDASEYLTTGVTTKITLSVYSDEEKTNLLTNISWNIQVVDVRLESIFNEKRTFNVGENVDFNYIAYGAVSKTIHFKLDGKEIGTYTIATSGNSSTFSIPGQAHGAHLFEIYATSVINGSTIETNHIYKDIVWYDFNKGPIIGCPYRKDYYGDVTIKQFNTLEIPFYIVDPSTNSPDILKDVTVQIKDTEGNILKEETSPTSTENLKNTRVFNWSFKPTEMGVYNLKLSCGSTYVEVSVISEYIGFEIAPAVGYKFDFNPSGKSNNNQNDKNWHEETNSDIFMEVSENFDWQNGGYILDDNGDSCFLIKSGTYVTFNYKLFGKDAKADGASFKLIFKTANVKKANASFLNCAHTDSETDKAGLQMNVHEAYITTSMDSLYIPYSEEDIIEFEYSINPLAIDEATGDYSSVATSYILSYEDGVALRPLMYNKSHKIQQENPKNIIIGSNDCDVYIYRMRAYEKALNDADILSNFIVDAPNSSEIVSRHDRNQIYETDDKILSPEYLAEKCPDLRIIKIEAPRFTYDKGDKVPDTTIQMIYKNGDPILDNWTCTGAQHSGQGTSSNKYGYAGRNLDLIMNKGGVFILGDGTPAPDNKITLTRNSIPTDYLNIKVNIASSENQNNAQMAQRYNRFNPYTRPAKKNNPLVKDCMEFFNCVVFIKETGQSYQGKDEDGNITTIIPENQEFKDNNWHFYAIGNVGDSKKTDNTRVDDKNDVNECVVEIMDYNVALAEFPKGEGAFERGNEAYDNLYGKGTPITVDKTTYDENGYVWEDGEVASFGYGSYEFRYEQKKITSEQRQANIDAWRRFYTFVVTSTDDEFKENLKNYFIVDSALYFYLFTERYTMVDNRAKNSFWHRGKVYITEEEATSLGDKAKNYIIDNEAANIENGYRWDLCFGYDFDTSLGIDNTGSLKLDYGKEDVDLYADGSYIYRAAKSTFFTRLRDLFPNELKSMFNNRETAYAWSSTGANGLIPQWDNAQAQFPEELWRRDIERKYLRTYQGSSIDNSIEKAADDQFFKGMLNGRKKYHRRQFERNQEVYFSSKYVSQSFQNNFIQLRAGNPVKGENGNITTADIVPPNYSLYLTPYIDMYLTVGYGNDGNRGNIRAKAGTEYKITYEGATADLTYIYGASYIQAIGDLSPFYPYAVSFAQATRLQSLKIGTDKKGYSNNFLTALDLRGNILLEHLDIRNTKALTSPLILSNCQNLKELYAEGSSIQGVDFANQGKLQIAHLPDTVTSISLRNLKDLTELVINKGSLIGVTIESSNLDEKEFALDVINNGKLQELYLYNINWVDDRALSSTEFLNAALEKKSEITGKIHIAGDIRSYELENYYNKWKDLTVTYDNKIQYYLVRYLNDDGSLIYSEYIQQGGFPDTDPIASGKFTTPVKASTQQYDFTFKEWGANINSAVIQNTDIMAIFNNHIRYYTVNWYSDNLKSELLDTQTVEYGTEVTYNGSKQFSGYFDTTTVQSHLFLGWDKSTGNVCENIDVYPRWEISNIPLFDKEAKKFKHPDGSVKELWEMTEGELHAIVEYDKKLNFIDNDGNRIFMWEIFDTKDYYDIILGNDFNFDNVKSLTVVPENEPLNFWGGNEGKGVDTGIKVFGEEDKSFTLAVDFRFSRNISNNTLVSCYREEGDGINTVIEEGFKLIFSGVENNGSPKIKLSNNLLTVGNYVYYSSTNNSISETNSQYRGIVVIRYNKENKQLYIYNDASTNGVSYNTEPKLFIDTKPDGSAKNIKNKYVVNLPTIPTKAIPLVLGAVKKDSGNYVNPGYGQINWCKFWEDDLGDENAKKLVSWPHEKVRMECHDSEPIDTEFALQSGVFNRYILVKDEWEKANKPDETIYSSICFGPQNVLQDRKMQMDIYGYSEVSDSFWSNCPGKDLLNDRIFNAFPLKWRQIIRTSVVPYSIDIYGALRNSENKIYLPSVYDLNRDNKADWIVAEGNQYFGPFTFYNSEYGRSKFDLISKVDGGKFFSTSFTQDPSLDPSNDIKPGDVWKTSNNGMCIYTDKDTIQKYDLNQRTYCKTDKGGWVMANSYFSRTRILNDSGSSLYGAITSYGSHTQATSKAYYGITPYFSI